jgi:RHS repeat-associated protein
MTLSAGSLTLKGSSTTLYNAGTFKANSTKFTEIGYEEALSKIQNSGVFEKNGSTEGKIEPTLENTGTVKVNAGTCIVADGGSSSSTSDWVVAEGTTLSLTGGSFAFESGGFSVSGSIAVAGASVSMTSANPNAATMLVSGGTLTVPSGSTVTASKLTLSGGSVNGSGTLEASSSFSWTGGEMTASGSTTVASGASATLSSGGYLHASGGRSLVNNGTMTLSAGGLSLIGSTTTLHNAGTFKANSPQYTEIGYSESLSKIVNTGTFEKTEGTETASIEPYFENYGRIVEVTAPFHFDHPVVVATLETQYGTENESSLAQIRALCGKPVDCVTGNETERQTDVSIGGRGVGLDLTRTYNAQAAAKAASAGMFGYGWSSSFSDRLVVESASHKATVYQANGSTVQFTEESGSFVAPSWSGDTLTGSSEAGYTLTLADQTKYVFNGSSGRLESVSDRNGNQTTLSYDEKGQLATITDPASRKIKLAYNAGGQVETAEDPMGHVVKYGYESGNLTSVTLPGETSPNWRFKYDTSHRMTVMINGLGGETTNVYDSSSRVTSQKDPLGHVLKFEYEAFQTKITNEATGAVTVEQFTSSDMVTSITHGYGTAAATTKKIVYNERNEPTAITDGNGHTTSYEYNAAGDRTKLTTPEGHETLWTYNATHDVTSVTRPNGEKTTITRDEHGNPTLLSRPAPKETTQETKFEYNTLGQPTSMTDPLGRKWTYEYDSKGDRTSETDPEGDKRTWAYNEDSQQTSTVSPRGNVEGGEPSKYTTSTERDAQGRPVKITDPLGHETHYGYDADGNQTSTKDANGHESKTTFNLANEPIKVTEPNGTVVETEYDGAGEVVAQIDGNKHTTKYVRNVLEQVTEVTDPLLRKTTKTYDLAGNLATIVDAAKRTTTYTHNKDNQLTKVAYSDGVTPTVEYEYDTNGNRKSMTDGTGKTTYTYDQLDQLTETKDGHGNVVGYEYDRAGQQTKITYPNGKTVERAYDKAGRLHSLTDWLEHTTSFAYDQNSNLTATTFPTGTGEQDTYAYNQADQQSEAKMLKGEEVLASLTYSRDSNGQVSTTVTKGLPGAETTEYGYDENERLSKAGANTYEYDAANNATKTPGSTNVFDAGDELTEGTGAKYSYGEVGERTKATPTSGPATTYGYDQAGNMTSLARPEEGSTPKIEDSYAYNGDGMRVSQTVSGKTSYLALDASQGLPLILSDGTNNYIYGPQGLPVEQIDLEGKVLYLHHDQQGSTRMLTGSSGTVEATMSFDPYGNAAGTTGTATTPLGYDGQYTNANTGLVYLRARSYDPGTAQFMSEDALSGLTSEPYGYANDNPLNLTDPSGLLFGLPGTPSTSEITGAISKGAESVANGAAEGLNTAGEAVNSVAHVAAPVIDGAAAVGCVAFADICGPVLLTNFVLQQILAGIQARYNPNYNLGLNELAIIGGTALGALGAGAVDLAKLRLIGRLALGGSIAAPQWLLNLFQLMSPEEAAALLGCRQ